MRIRHIYITKEGEPMANPYMEYPKKPSKEWDIRMGGRERNKIRGLWKKYENRLNKYHSGLLPFEDKKTLIDILTDEAIDNDGFLKKDTIIPVDLEVEVVEQHRWLDCGGEWYEGKITNIDAVSKMMYQERKVLRIKPLDDR